MCRGVIVAGTTRIPAAERTPDGLGYNSFWPGAGPQQLTGRIDLRARACPRVTVPDSRRRTPSTAPRPRADAVQAAAKVLTPGVTVTVRCGRRCTARPR